MSFTYSYTSLDFLLGEAFNTGKLHEEIESSSLTGLIEGIVSEGDSVNVYFSRELLPAEETVLSGLIESHEITELDTPPSTTSVVAVSSNDTFPNYLSSKLVEGSNITITVGEEGGDEKLTITGADPGEANTASNIQSLGLGFFSQKNGIDLEFRGIRTTSNKLYMALNGSNNSVDLDIIPGNIPHGDLADTGSYPHIAIDAHIADTISNPHQVLAVQVPDFDTEVDNNSTVVLNTASRDRIKISASDTLPGYLTQKLSVGAGLALTTFNAGSNEYLEITVPGGVGEANTASNIGLSGVSVYKQKTGVDLEFKSISPQNSKVTVTEDVGNTTVIIGVNESLLDISSSQISDIQTTIDNNSNVSANTASRSKVKVSVNDTTPGFLDSKLVQGTDITITEGNDGSNEILTFSVTGGKGEVNTASNINVGGVGVFSQKVGTDLQFRGINSSTSAISVNLEAGTNQINLGLNPSSISHTSLSDIGLNTHAQIDNHIANVSNPHSVTASQLPDFDSEVESNGVVAENLSLRGKSKVSANDTGYGFLTDKLVSGSNIVLSQLNDGADETLEISFTGTLGEVNTASNIGTEGIGIFSQKVSSDLQFKNLVVSSPLSINDNTTNKTVELELNTSQISHTSLADIGVNTHAQIDSHLSNTSIHFSINDLGSETTSVLSSSEVDSRIQQAQLSTFTLKGDWDASTNTPTITSGVGTLGDLFRVSVAGTTSIDGVSDWQINDQLYFDGTSWRKIDNSDSVLSVNGLSGAVVLTTDNISEGVSNFYYTDARVAANSTVVDLTNSKGEVFASSTDSTTGTLLDKLVAGTNITLELVGSAGTEQTLRINSTATAGNTYTASNVNTVGVGVFDYLDGTNFRFLGVSAGSSKVSVFRNASDAISVDVVPSSIDHGTLANVGANSHAQIDAHIYSTANPHGVTAEQVINLSSYISNNTDVQGNTLARYKTKVSDTDTTEDYLGSKLSSGSGISISTLNGGSYEILQISSTVVPGEINTASNINNIGFGVYDQKVGTELQFRGIVSSSARLSVALDDINNAITLDVVPSQISHTALQDIGTNTHSQIDAHISDLTIHRSIDDASSNTTSLLSSAEIDSRIASNSGGGSGTPTDFQMISDPTVSITTSELWQNKITMTTPVLPPGTYKITFTYMWNHDNTSDDFEAAVRYDTFQKFYHKQEPTDRLGSFNATGTSQRHSTSAFVILEETRDNLSHTIELCYRTSTSGVPSSIWEATVTFQRLGDTGLGALNYTWVVEEPAC